MAPFESMLVAYDGSEPARACLSLAARCAARWHSKMMVCYALDTERLLVPAAGLSLETYLREGADLIVDALRACRACGVDAESALRDEPALDGILAAAAQSRADLIVIGTHGRSGLGRAALGSVAEDVLRHSALPALTVRSNGHSDGPFGNILVAMDESAGSASAFRFAEVIAEADGSTLQLIYVDAPGDSREHREKALRALDSARERHPNAQVHRPLAEDAGSTICEFAERINAELVVVGSHGRKGLTRALLGSVAETVVRHAACPTLVAKVDATLPK
jgi:nucleotide-binding universal stress UspA family protein